MSSVGQVLHDLGGAVGAVGEPLALLGKVACLSLACGLGPYLYAVPARVKGTFLAAVLPLTLGMGVIAVAAVYCLALGAPITWAVPGALALSGACLLGGLARPADLAARLRAAAASVGRWKYELVAALALPVLVIGPAFHADGPAQPMRIGVDEMGYAITAQYLLDGGSLASLRGEVLTQTGMADLDAALAGNAKALKVNTNIASEFLLKSLRWYPAALAAVLSAVGEKYALPLQFLLLYFPLVLLFGVAYHFLRGLTGMPAGLSALGAAALLFNVNLLNILCEGQHAQVFGAPFFFLLMGQLFLFRNTPADTSADGRAARRQERVFTCLLAVIVLASFSELIFLTAVLTALVVALDLVLRRRVAGRPLLEFGAAVGLGFALAGPYGIAWPAFLLSHLKHLQTGGGFWQPQWACAAEILGLFDIYQTPVAEYVGRGAWGGNTALGLSLVCAELVAIRFLLRARGDAPFWLAPILFIGAVYIKTRYVNHLHNYQYMKAYTLVMLPTLCLFLGSLHALAKDFRGARVLVAGCLLWMVIKGGGYLKRYAEQATHLPYSAAAVTQLRNAVDWDNYVWLTTSGGIDKLGYASLVPINWLNLGWDCPNLAPHAGKQIGIWCDRKDLRDLKQPPEGGAVVYQDQKLVLFKTGKALVPADFGADGGAPAEGEKARDRMIGFCRDFLRARGFIPGESEDDQAAEEGEGQGLGAEKDDGTELVNRSTAD